jgi:FixJ family two-component response regulator
MNKLWEADSVDGGNTTPVTGLISIVDDDASIRRSTLRILRSVGMRAEVFASAEEFLASKEVEKTACLILDLRMPGMSGLELQKHLAKVSNPVPIIFFSAHSSPKEERQLVRAGVFQFLQKPVSKDVLLTAIRNALKTQPNDERRTS